MNRKAAILSAALALTVIPAAYCAGTDSSDSADTPTEDAPAIAGPSSGAESNPDIKQPAPGKPEDAEANDSAFDYESSEQISEDKSVSFPVDI